ncbi:hypothetical protein RHMOL_Rhmol09G0053700 [Rhododendron molle]|uniref:Uncharacterized protein n=1 Tax=Rhododendron molle TaxID=49168 RepID=A0ACC0MBZ0_RHOML|nr:hypothetical protein RHMOL_Rhmol09G0053700 [Rhododendron molle]
MPKLEIGALLELIQRYRVSVAYIKLVLQALNHKASAVGSPPRPSLRFLQSRLRHFSVLSITPQTVGFFFLDSHSLEVDCEGNRRLGIVGRGYRQIQLCRQIVRCKIIDYSSLFLWRGMFSHSPGTMLTLQTELSVADISSQLVGLPNMSFKDRVVGAFKTQQILFQSHKWTVYVRGATNEDHGVVVKRAVFQLHASFNNPTRVLESPPSEVSESGWGEFEIAITLHFHSDICEKPLHLSHIGQIGYRDGVTAGKEASAQEGFNMGFKESVGVGYNWGLVRGVTSALTCLPDGMKEKLVVTQEEKDKFQSLYESVHSLSTTDALKLFHDDILTDRSVEHSENAEASPNEAGTEMAERMAYFGLSVNMVAFMFYVMHRPFSSSANAMNIFLGISQTSSVLGGFLADAYLGRYGTIAISLLYISQCTMDFILLTTLEDLPEGRTKVRCTKFQVSRQGGFKASVVCRNTCIIDCPVDIDCGYAFVLNEKLGAENSEAFSSPSRESIKTAPLIADDSPYLLQVVKRKVLDRFTKCRSTVKYIGRKARWDVQVEELNSRRENEESCDLFSGKWVFDNSSYPLYNESDCPYMSDQLACHKHGQADLGGQIWVINIMLRVVKILSIGIFLVPVRLAVCGLLPLICRWNLTEMWEKLRGKRLMFVGDSLNRGQWISMVCLLQSVIPVDKRSMSPNAHLTIFRAEEYNATVEFLWAPLLVDSNSNDPVNHRLDERIMQPDSVLRHASQWEHADILVFNTYLWWSQGPVKLLWSSEGDGVCEEIDGLGGMELAMEAWANWVASNVNPLKKQVFFVTMSPTHLWSREWETSEGNCYNEKTPIKDEGYWGSGPTCLQCEWWRGCCIVLVMVHYYIDLDTGMFVTNPKLMPMLLKAVRESLDEKASSL